MNIRTATVADTPSLISLERECTTAAHWTEQQYQYLFLTDERLVLVAEHAPNESGPEPGRDPGLGILGFLVAHHLAPEWELENMVVAPQSSRQGIGSHLLKSLLAAAREKSSTSVFLEVRESNAGARSLYEKTGFKAIGRRGSYYTSPLEDAILYRRTLG